MISTYQICVSRMTYYYLQHLKTMPLVLELEEIGLILNPNKTQLLTTELHDHDFVFLQNWSKIDVIRDHASHKLLGKAICFTKASLHCHAIDSRIVAAIRSFYAKKHILCAKISKLVFAWDISIRQYFKLHVLLDHKQHSHVKIIIYSTFYSVLSRGKLLGIHHHEITHGHTTTSYTRRMSDWQTFANRQHHFVERHCSDASVAIYWYRNAWRLTQVVLSIIALDSITRTRSRTSA